MNDKISCHPFRWRAENCRDIQEAVVAAAAADAEAREARQHGVAAEPVRVLLRQQRTAETAAAAAGAATGAEAGTGTVSNCNSLACFLERDVIHVATIGGSFKMGHP